MFRITNTSGCGIGLMSLLCPPPPLKNATLRANEMIKLSKKNVVIGGERGGGVL